VKIEVADANLFFVLYKKPDKLKNTEKELVLIETMSAAFFAPWPLLERI